MTTVLDDSITSVEYNGTPVDVVEFNGVEVWRANKDDWTPISINTPYSSSSTTNLGCSNVWTDGDNLYVVGRYQNGAASTAYESYMFNRSNSSWVTKYSTYGAPFTNWNGSSVWTDGENIYSSFSGYSGSTYYHYVWDKTTSTWKPKTWHGYTNFSDDNIWTDGENIYLTLSVSANYVLDKSTSTWIKKTWNGLSGETSFSRSYIWTDGENIYASWGYYKSYRYYYKHYVLDKSTSTWIKKTWNGDLIPFIDGSDPYVPLSGSNVWSDGENIYYTTRYQRTSGSSTVNYDIQYVLNKATNTWSRKSWNLTTIYGNAVKIIEGNAYYSVYTSSGTYTGYYTTYILDKETSRWNSIYVNKTAGLDGSCIWTDGDNTYYSSGSSQYVLDKSTYTWSTKTWSGLTSFYGYSIWSDGENIYYSSDSSQYVLNKATNTWSRKSWNGLTSFSGSRIWSDGDNIYYSNGSGQCVLDKSTSTWSTKTWSGLTSFYGYNIWSDGENIYYSNGSDQYVLDKSTSTWSTKTWSGLTSFYAGSIWSDGENIYYSNDSDLNSNTVQYVLNSETSTWEEKTWDGRIPNFGQYVWNDNVNIYYSYGADNLIYRKTLPQN